MDDVEGNWEGIEFRVQVLKCTNLIVLLGERALLVGDQTTGRIMDGWERGSSDHSIMMLLIRGHEYVGGY